MLFNFLKRAFFCIPLKWRRVTILFLSIIFIDQITKYGALFYLKNDVIIRPLPILDLVLVKNYGVSFGLFRSQGMLGVWVLSGIALLLCLWLLSMIHQSQKPLEYKAYGIIISGAIGNVIDRFSHGGVVDFLYFHLNHYYWPAFNIADIAIVLGAILIAFEHLIDHKKTLKKKGKAKR